ncbi:response regulator transcription factor [Actinopolymorpha pittospori]|uniref:Two-component system response regulator QseB n=1 Tax=Actinopolymorpha pittospori TaxID=648752 RepID=A0A927RHD4_9ACTN|nr:response regulator transcription factor [Actinopolymorpha pittospori]MBE1603333.1 two-component system response regulator QseB [Actinopolymorpha pittospori]
MRRADGTLAGTARAEAGQPVPLLLVEDDPALVAMLVGLLTEEGYAVDTANDGQRGLHLALSRGYEVLLLDRGLPAIDGLDLLGRLRRSGVVTPVMVLSALGNPADRVEGLDAGAEDYLAKPFDVEELLARLRALRRRHLDAARILPVGDLRLNLDSREVSGPISSTTHEVPLSRRECDLLALLARRPSQIFSRSELLARVFPRAECEVIVDTYVHYLRRKLGRQIVSTVRGEGYRLGRRPSR